MPSVAGIRLGLCFLRYGPQPGMPFLFFCRQNHSVADPRITDSGRLSSSCGMSTVAVRKPAKPFTVDLSELSNEMKIAESYRYNRRFITDPGLVNNILYSLNPGDHRTTPIIMEYNPGPGILTRALLDAGYNVVALESDTAFLPGLKKLEQNTDGQLRVFHCDLFRLDPWAEGVVEAPTMYSWDLMEQLGIKEVPWDTEIPLRVFGILNSKKEKLLMWRYIYALYERLSIFRYGRIEFNFLISEQLSKCLLAKPGDFRPYQAFTVLYNIACDVQLLHKVPISTFCTSKKFKHAVVKSGESSADHLCLVRITPRRNLFSERFSTLDGKLFVNMIKQCLVKRKSNLLCTLDSWTPGDGKLFLQILDLPENIKTGSVYPKEYRLLFDLLRSSEDFCQSFLFDGEPENLTCSAH